jgi:hypothetical protein
MSPQHENTEKSSNSCPHCYTDSVEYHLASWVSCPGGIQECWALKLCHLEGAPHSKSEHKPQPMTFSTTPEQSTQQNQGLPEGAD